MTQVNMREKILVSLLVLALSGAPALNAQNKEKIAVEKVVLELFDAMRAGDSSRAATLFHPNVRMMTSFRDSSGQSTLREGSLADFLHAVGSPHPKIWDERIRNTEVRIDENLAQVWTEYAFYVGEEFSHCGVDAFQLVRGKDGLWRIVNLIDTRRNEGCQRF